MHTERLQCSNMQCVSDRNLDNHSSTSIGKHLKHRNIFTQDNFSPVEQTMFFSIAELTTNAHLHLNIYMCRHCSSHDRFRAVLLLTNVTVIMSKQRYLHNCKLLWTTSHITISITTTLLTTTTTSIKRFFSR